MATKRAEQKKPEKVERESYPARAFVNIPVALLVKAPWNYKREEPAKQKKLLENFRRIGQVENILVREIGGGKFEVVNGNHRLTVLEELKMAEAVCYNFGSITTAEACRIAVETNETRFDTDRLKLAEVLKGIAKDFPVSELAVTMPYSEGEIDDMVHLLDFDWDTYDRKRDDKEKKEPEPPVCQSGDVWVVGSHVVSVGEVNPSAVDEALRHLQKTLKVSAVLQASGNTYAQERQLRLVVDPVAKAVGDGK